MNTTFENLITLIESTDEKSVRLGLVLAQNYQKKFKKHFGCKPKEYEELLDFLLEIDQW